VDGVRVLCYNSKPLFGILAEDEVAHIVCIGIVRHPRGEDRIAQQLLQGGQLTERYSRGWHQLFIKRDRVDHALLQKALSLGEPFDQGRGLAA